MRDVAKREKGQREVKIKERNKHPKCPLLHLHKERKKLNQEPTTLNNKSI